MPSPPSDLDVTALLGEWHIVATTLPFWRGKRRPVVRYEAVSDAPITWRDTLSFEQRALFSGAWTSRTLVGVDTGVAGAPGAFVWRGEGVLGVLRSAWCFVAVDPAGAWAATWFARATFGVTPEGMDVYARHPEIERSVVEGVIAGFRADPELGRLGGWYRTDR